MATKFGWKFSWIDEDRCPGHTYRQARSPTSVTPFSHLSINLSLSFFLSIYLPIYHLSTDLSIYLSVCLSFHPSIHLSISVSVSLSIHLAVYLSVYLSIYPSTYLFISIYGLSACTYLSIHRASAPGLSLWPRILPLLPGCRSKDGAAAGHRRPIEAGLEALDKHTVATVASVLQALRKGSPTEEGAAGSSSQSRLVTSGNLSLSVAADCSCWPVSDSNAGLKCHGAL